MYKKDVLAHYNHRQANVARALGISNAAVWAWGDIIPESKAYRLERITGGTLRVDPSLYEKPAKSSHEAA